MPGDNTDFKISIISSADNTGFKEAGAAAGELSDSTKDYAKTIQLTDEQAKQFTSDADDLREAENKTGESARGSSAEHRALHQALDRLNELIPGLGTTLALFAHGLQGEAAAARDGAAANDVFVASLGPIAVLLLSIQVAIEYWSQYKDNVKAAEAAQTAMFEKFQEDTKSALDAWEAFQNALKPKDSATKKYSDDISLQNELLGEQVKKNKEIIKVNEDADLAKAKTPEDKAAVKKRYEQQTQAQDDFAANRKIGIDEQAANSIQSDIAGRSQEVEKTRQQIVDAQKSGADYSQLTAYMAEQTKAVTELEAQLAELNTKINAAKQVQGAATSGAAQVESAKVIAGQDDPEIAAGASAAFAVEHGQKLNQAQTNSLNILLELFKTITGNTDGLTAAAKYSLQKHLSNAQEIKLIKNQMQALAQQTQAAAKTQ